MSKKRYRLAYYEIDNAYGGPEEGGWWYETGQLVVHPARRRYATTEEARTACARANRLLAHLQRNKRHVSSMAYAGGRYVVKWSEGKPKTFYPARRPHYE